MKQYEINLAKNNEYYRDLVNKSASIKGDKIHGMWVNYLDIYNTEIDYSLEDYKNAFYLFEEIYGTRIKIINLVFDDLFNKMDSEDDYFELLVYLYENHYELIYKFPERWVKGELPLYTYFSCFQKIPQYTEDVINMLTDNMNLERKNSELIVSYREVMTYIYYMILWGKNQTGTVRIDLEGLIDYIDTVEKRLVKYKTYRSQVNKIRNTYSEHKVN